MKKRTFEVEYETARDRRGKSQQKIEVEDMDAKKRKPENTRNE